MNDLSLEDRCETSTRTGCSERAGAVVDEVCVLIVIGGLQCCRWLVDQKVARNASGDLDLWADCNQLSQHRGLEQVNGSPTKPHEDGSAVAR